MTGTETDPNRFFDAFPGFLESSETGHGRNRLNARYVALVHDNRDVIAGARVLDLACHDGRFTFAALDAGAEHVVGVDHKAHLVDIGRNHLAAYGIAPDRYDLRSGDLFECIEALGGDGEGIDVVFCFGILYHLTDHLRLFRLLAELGPRALIIDTRISLLDGAVIELRSPTQPGPPPPGSQLEAQPTRAALDAMISSFGWEWRYVDWTRGDLAARKGVADYHSGQRVSVVVTCPEHDVPPDVRREAVERVLAARTDLEHRYLSTAMVAKRLGLAPQALWIWVQRAERDRRRGVGER